MNNVYYARSENELHKKETVQHHLKRTAELCAEFLSVLAYEDFGQALGTFHDFGKYSALFQEVLLHQRTHVNHAYPGAAADFQCCGKRSALAEILAAVIASHHGHLDYDWADRTLLKRVLCGTGSRLDREGYEFSLFGLLEFQNAMERFQRENTIPVLHSALPDFQRQEDASLAKMLFTRFLFSALVDADYSSSAEHFESDYLTAHTGPALNPVISTERLLAVQTQKKEASSAASSLNEMRDELFENCRQAAKLPPGLFTLTAPTGLGKTLSLFAFAVEHCQEHRKRRIILILPYLAIIDQNLKDYRQIEPDLLECHSNAELREDARLLAQRWESPCIVTTNVGFFEPLFSAQPTVCRHLHAIANSVIVLDEAQSLPPHLLDATLRTVKLLCEQYGCTVVFSTATQPSFQYRPGLQWKPREIVPHPEMLFRAARRVEFEWRIQTPTPLCDLAEELSQKWQSCVIVNLRAHARLLYQKLAQRCGNEDTFYLTTDLCPAHRLALVNEVKTRLAEGKSCRLVATQCIEAGVDLDFPTVYQALAPLESIIQAAGRCNRNGNKPDGRVVVFLPDEKKLYPPGGYYEHGANCVQVLLSRHPIDCNDLEHIREYYELLYSYGDGDLQKLRDALQNEQFDKVEASYKLIDNKGVQVIVPYEGQSELYDRIKAEYDAAGLTGKLIHLARSVTVSCFDERSVRLNCEPLLFRSPEMSERGETGYYLLGNGRFYKKDLGLYFGDSEDNLYIL